MMRYIYNASILRFRPYRDVGEFVNIGVLISFPQINKIVFQMEKRRKRITNFFPEIDRNMLGNAFSHIQKQFNEATDNKSNSLQEEAFVFDFVSREANEVFRRLTVISEGLFVFSETISGVAYDVRAKIDELFEHYVKRNFPANTETRELRLEKAFRRTLTKFSLLENFKTGHLGNDIYNFRIPFFNEKLAIRTLCLDRETPFDVYECGDQWDARLGRLERLQAIQAPILFPISYPKQESANLDDAVMEVNEKLKKFGFVHILPITATNQVIEYIKHSI